MIKTDKRLLNILPPKNGEPARNPYGVKGKIGKDFNLDVDEIIKLPKDQLSQKVFPFAVYFITEKIVLNPRVKAETRFAGAKWLGDLSREQVFRSESIILSGSIRDLEKMYLEMQKVKEKPESGIKQPIDITVDCKVQDDVSDNKHYVNLEENCTQNDTVS